jgi:hypothetical protein
MYYWPLVGITLMQIFVRVLITKLIDHMKKLKMTNVLQAQETTSNQQWNHAF